MGGLGDLTHRVAGMHSACALLFQHPEAMLFKPTVREELAYVPRQLRPPEVEARVVHWAAELGLSPLLDKAPFLLSGGQKQKAALGCLLTLDLELLLLDEPSASLAHCHRHRHGALDHAHVHVNDWN